MSEDSLTGVPYGEPKTTSPVRRAVAWALVLVPILLFGGNYVMDKVTASLDGKCVPLDTNAKLCVHRENQE